MTQAVDLEEIVVRHTVVGGYPDTHAIARDAYALGSQEVVRLREAAIMLRRSGDYAIVSLLLNDGRDVELIRERVDGNFSHIIEPSGIAKAIGGES